MMLSQARCCVETAKNGCYVLHAIHIVPGGTWGAGEAEFAVQKTENGKAAGTLHQMPQQGVGERRHCAATLPVCALSQSVT